MNFEALALKQFLSISNEQLGGMLQLACHQIENENPNKVFQLVTQEKGGKFAVFVDGFSETMGAIFVETDIWEFIQYVWGFSKEGILAHLQIGMVDAQKALLQHGHGQLEMTTEDGALLFISNLLQPHTTSFFANKVFYKKNQKTQTDEVANLCEIIDFQSLKVRLMQGLNELQ